MQFFAVKEVLTYIVKKYVLNTSDTWPPSLWQLIAPLIFVRFSLNFLYMCTYCGAHAQEVWAKSDKD